MPTPWPRCQVVVTVIRAAVMEFRGARTASPERTNKFVARIVGLGAPDVQESTNSCRDWGTRVCAKSIRSQSPFQDA
jgi:hypothetical protein